MTKEPNIEPVIAKAWAFAEAAHRGQLDDDGKDFFVTHPVQVCILLTGVSADVNLRAAALLHDVVEDTKVTEEELRKEFCDDVVGLVMEVTHEGRKDSGGYYFPRLHSQRGLMLKYADRLSNLSRLGGKAWAGKRAEAYVKKSIKGFPTEPNRCKEEACKSPVYQDGLCRGHFGIELGKFIPKPKEGNS